MSKTMGLCMVAGLFATAGAQAQESLTFYGNLDAGVTYLSNSGGRSRLLLGSGAAKPSRIGLRGQEDLGGGWKAILNLETGINVHTGTQADANAIFNREASLGLRSASLGTLKMGRMPDFFLADIGVLDSTPLIEGGMMGGFTGFGRPAGTAGAPPPVNAHYGGARYNNAIKWLADFGHFRVGLMHALNGNAGDKMWAAMARYAADGLAVGMAYTKDNFTTSVFARETFAIKAHYADGPVIYLANYAIGKDTTSQAENRPLELAVQYAVGPWRIGGGIGYARATNAAGLKARISQPFAGVKYMLSKRTELYAAAAFNRTSDKAVVPATVSAPGGASAVSTTNSMNAVRLGIVVDF